MVYMVYMCELHPVVKKRMIGYRARIDEDTGRVGLHAPQSCRCIGCSGSDMMVTLLFPNSFPRRQERDK